MYSHDIFPWLINILINFNIWIRDADGCVNCTDDIKFLLSLVLSLGANWIMNNRLDAETGLLRYLLCGLFNTPGDRVGFMGLFLFSGVQDGE